MEPINRNPQNMQRQSSSGGPASQPKVHGSWNGRPLDKYGAIVMIPTPGINSNGNDEQPTPDSRQMGPPSNWKPVVINPRPSNTSSTSNEVQSVANSDQIGPAPNQQPVVMISTPSNNLNGNQVQHAANSHRMGPSPNRQPVVMNHTPIDTSSGNEVQYAAYGDRLGVMIPKPSNANTNGNQVQLAAQSHRMGTPHNHQSTAMSIPHPSNTSTSNALQPNASQANVTGSLHPTSSIASNNFPPAWSNSEALTSMVHHNNMMVSSRPPFGAQGVTTSAPNCYRPNVDQNLNCNTPYADQRLGSTSNVPQNPQANSSWRPHANPQGAFVWEQQRTMAQASINRSPGYIQSTSSNTNGVGCVPTSSNCPPMVRPPSHEQQKSLQADAMKRRQMEDQNVANACVRRFKNYLHDWQQCLKNNASEQWRKFVAHYYAPEAKRLCCQAALQGQSANKHCRSSEGWSTCCHCRMNSNKSQEVSFAELAIVFQHKFTEYKDETLVEYGQFSAWKSGTNAVFLFKHAVEKAENDQFIYLRKGRLAVEFKADMKIVSWQFCMSSCEKVDRSHALACSKLNQMLQNARDSSSASRCQPTSRHQTQNQPISNSTYPSTSGAKNKEVNLPAPQFTNSTNVFDTSAYAFGGRPVTGTTSSSVNPSSMINPLCVGPHANALPGPSDSAGPGNLLKRTASTENGPVMDDLQQRVTRRRLDDASFSGTGCQNFASTADQTQGLAVDRNMGSGANQEHWSGIENFDTCLDSFEIEILESLGL